MVYVLLFGSIVVVGFLTGIAVGYMNGREDSERKPLEGWGETSELIQRLTGCTVTGGTALDPWKVRAYVAKLEQEHAGWLRDRMEKLAAGL